MDKTGKAGQWTFDFYLDKKPEISVKDGKKFYTYENLNIAVTGNFIGGGPYIDSLYTTGIMQPREEYVRTYEKAFKLALTAAQKEKFDFISATCRDYSGKPSWIFSFFKKGFEHVISIQVKADGTKILLKER